MHKQKLVCYMKINLCIGTLFEIDSKILLTTIGIQQIHKSYILSQNTFSNVLDDNSIQLHLYSVTGKLNTKNLV
jgi:hypothetical protein